MSIFLAARVLCGLTDSVRSSTVSSSCLFVKTNTCFPVLAIRIDCLPNPFDEGSNYIFVSLGSTNTYVLNKLKVYIFLKVGHLDTDGKWQMAQNFFVRKDTSFFQEELPCRVAYNL